MSLQKDLAKAEQEALEARQDVAEVRLENTKLRMSLHKAEHNRIKRSIPSPINSRHVCRCMRRIGDDVQMHGIMPLSIWTDLKSRVCAQL